MQLDEDRARLKGFLLHDTELKRKTAFLFIRHELMEERRLSGMDEVEPTDEEVRDEMIKRREALPKFINAVMDDLCKQILPKERLWDLAKQFGIFAVFLIAPVGALVRCAFQDYAAGNLAAAGADSCAALMLLMLLTASAITVFRKERKK